VLNPFAPDGLVTRGGKPRFRLDSRNPILLSKAKPAFTGQPSSQDAVMSALLMRGRKNNITLLMLFCQALFQGFIVKLRSLMPTSYLPTTYALLTGDKPPIIFTSPEPSVSLL
jgi:hypothetical protein